MKKLGGLILLCLLISVLIFTKTEKMHQYSFDIPAKIGESTLKLKIIEEGDDLIRGLSGQSKIAKDEGLLFVFPTNKRAGIWMKDMNFPIDVMWIDENMKVVSIKENFLPTSYPEIAYPSQDSKYVLEVVAGFVTTNKILLGDEFKILTNSL